MFTLEVLKSRTEDIKEKLSWCIPDFVITQHKNHTVFRCNFNSLAYTYPEINKFEKVFKYLADLKEPYFILFENHITIIGTYTNNPSPTFINIKFDSPQNFDWDEHLQKYARYKLLQMTE